MRTRRAGKTEAPAGEAQPTGVRKGGVRKVTGAKKVGAVVTKRVVLRGRKTSSLREGVNLSQPAAAKLQDGPGAAETTDLKGEEQQQQQQAQEPAAAAAGSSQQLVAASTGHKRLSAVTAKSTEAAATIESLSTEALQEVFVKLCQQDGDQQSYCREILPLVCKRFRDVLLEPSSVWETVHVDFLQKGQDCRYPEMLVERLQQAGELHTFTGDASNRRLLHSSIERWLKPRAAAVKHLVLSFSARDQTHSFPLSGVGLRCIFRLLAPTLQELSIAHCSDIFHARAFADLALLKNLESLAVTFMTGKVSAADLAPLEQLGRLRSMTLSASRQAEEGGQHCLVGFPETLLKLRSLTSLAVSSLGVTNLPTSLVRLKCLSSLDVSGCPLSFLPSNLWRLAALRHLRLNSTNLLVGLAHTWEPLGKLPQLESVELRDTKAVTLPPSLTGLSALTCLDLSDNTFEVLGGEEEGLLGLASLPSLQRLLLRCCQLPSVPAEVASLSRLTHLDLSRNQLVELPPGLSGLVALRELVAEGNCFPRIPQVLAELPALEVADLSFNIYMEAASSLGGLVAGGRLARLQRLDLRKMLGMWKQSSIRWLRGLVQELEQQRADSGEPRPVVVWD